MTTTTPQPWTAVVTIRVPDARGGSVAVRLPVGRAAYTRSAAAFHLESDDLIAAVLDRAKIAADDGNPAAALVAARILQARPDLPWPAWLAAATIATMEGAARGRGGRHANPWTKWRDDQTDYVRYRVVELLRDNGRPVPDVYEDAAKYLVAREGAEHGKGLGDAIAKAYGRVMRRTGAYKRRRLEGRRYHPRYFPDVATLHALHAADVVMTTGNKPR